jgi:hypothetical protein
LFSNGDIITQKEGVVNMKDGRFEVGDKVRLVDDYMVRDGHLGYTEYLQAGEIYHIREDDGSHTFPYTLEELLLPGEAFEDGNQHGWFAGNVFELVVDEMESVGDLWLSI